MAFIVLYESHNFIQMIAFALFHVVQVFASDMRRTLYLFYFFSSSCENYAVYRIVIMSIVCAPVYLDI